MIRKYKKWSFILMLLLGVNFNTLIAANNIDSLASRDSLAGETAKESVVVDSPPQTDTFIENVVVSETMDYGSPKTYIVGGVNVTGVKFGDPDHIIGISGIKVGDTVTLPGDYITTVVKRFWSQLLYNNVRVLVSTEGDKAMFTIQMRENSKVSKWDLVGIRQGQMKDLLETLKLKRGSELTTFKLNNTISSIKKFFVEKGFYNVTVTPKITMDSNVRQAVRVVLNIDKGKKVKIKSITFTGDSVFKEKKLRQSLKKLNQVGILFWKSFKYTKENYEAGKKNLIDFYNSKGYRNARIISDTAFLVSPNRLGVVFNISEGAKYYYKDVMWIGNTKYPSELLNRILRVKKGDVYDRKTINERLGIEGQDESSVSSLYQDNGYLFFKLEPIEKEVAGDSINLEVRIVEGKQATVNNIIIRGNTKTNEHVVRRSLFTYPGDLFSKSMLMRSYRELASLGHFDPEKIDVEPIPLSQELVDIHFGLTEKANDQLELSAGWGAGMFVGSVGIRFTNISIRNFFKKGAWKPYPAGDSQTIVLQAQTNGTYYKAFSLQFVEPWLGGKKPNSFSVSAHYSSENDSRNFFVANNKTTQSFETWGVAVGLGQRLSWPDSYFQIYNELMYESYKMRDWPSFLFTNGKSNVIALKTVLGRNSTDQPIYPREGSDISLTLQLTPPYSLFNKKMYEDPNLPDETRYKWIEYHKWKFNSTFYFSISKNDKLVLMARMELGYLGHYNKNAKSPFEGFAVGGDGISGYNMYGVETIGLRGYENQALTPYADYGTYARAFAKFTLELRYPIVLSPQTSIYALAFLEAGNAWEDLKDVDLFSLRRSAGIGVRLFLPMIGMLGIDWGYGFDKVPGSSKPSGSQFHFTIGMPM